MLIKMKDARPVFLNLFQIRFPCTAIASILHRVSGVVNFLALALWVSVLDCSLRSPAGLASVKAWFQLPLIKFVLWGFLAALTYHVLAGIRHLFADVELGESLGVARFSAYLMFTIAIVLIALEGYWLW